MRIATLLTLLLLLAAPASAQDDLVISGVVLWWIRREPGGIWQKIAAGLLIGGAMGNVVDRLVYGAVADFLNMSCCGIDNPYAFNVADIAVFAGAVGMVIFTGEKKAA